MKIVKTCDPTQLMDITDIRSGYLFGSLEDDSNGNIRVIQPGDVDRGGHVELTGLCKVRIDNVRGGSLITSGDVVFKAKGINPVASMIDESDERIMATNHFFILKIKDERVLPEYLCWYLNQEPARRYFKTVAGISIVPTITKKILGKLDISVPDIEIQKKITRVNKLQERERDLIERIQSIRKKITIYALMKAAGKGVFNDKR